MRSTRLVRGLTPLVVLALIGAACTDDDDPSSDGTAPEQVADTEAPTDEPTETDASTATEAPAEPTEEVQSSDSLLDTVLANDVVRCGTRDALPGLRRAHRRRRSRRLRRRLLQGDRRRRAR